MKVSSMPKGVEHSSICILPPSLYIREGIFDAERR